MSTKTCDACGISHEVNRKRDWLAHHCRMEGQSAVDATHPACPTHGTLIWTVGPYSTYRVCDRKWGCQAGKNGKPYRYCAPRGSGRDADSDDGPSESDEVSARVPGGDSIPTRDVPGFPPTAEGSANPYPAYPSKDESVTSKTSAPTALPADATAAIAQLLNALTPKAPAVDPAAVQAMVDAAVDAKLATSTRITLVVDSKDAPAVEIDAPHPYLSRVIKLVKAGLPVYLWGPAGGGKTTAAMQVARALNRDFEIDTLDPSTFRSTVQGFLSPTGAEMHTSFTRCWTAGKIYIPDEVDNGPGHVQTLYNSALANGHAPLAWGNVERGEDFGFIGTGNTPGRPTRAFPDRKPMSAAFADRLYFVHWPLDCQAERAWSGVGGKAKSQIPTSTPRAITEGQWVDYVQNLREWAATNAPTLMITPRASIVGLRALRCGETPEQVADGLIFRGADDEIRSKANAAVRIP